MEVNLETNSKDQIPPQLLPLKPENDITVPVDTSPLEADMETVAAFCQELGLVNVSLKNVKGMYAAGAALERLGVTRLTQSNVIGTQQALVSMVGGLHEAFEKPGLKPNDKALLARSAGYVAFQIARCSSTLNQASEKKGGRKGSQRRSFSPGEVVTNNTQININTPRVSSEPNADVSRDAV